MKYSQYLAAMQVNHMCKQIKILSFSAKKSSHFNADLDYFFNMRKLIFCSLDPDTGAKIRGIFRIRILSTGLFSLTLINI